MASSRGWPDAGARGSSTESWSLSLWFWPMRLKVEVVRRAPRWPVVRVPTLPLSLLSRTPHLLLGVHGDLASHVARAHGGATRCTAVHVARGDRAVQIPIGDWCWPRILFEGVPSGGTAWHESSWGLSRRLSSVLMIPSPAGVAPAVEARGAAVGVGAAVSCQDRATHRGRPCCPCHGPHSSRSPRSSKEEGHPRVQLEVCLESMLTRQLSSSALVLSVSMAVTAQE